MDQTHQVTKIEATPLTESEILRKLGPLRHLAGTWEGDKGDDVAPGDDRGIEENKYRERISFIPFGPVNNHEQELFGLKYSTIAWRIGEENSFHEEAGYWLWDAKESQVMRAFLVPRGISVLAGGTAQENDIEFSLKAELGSPIYGICSNPFLDREFKTVRFDLTVTLLDENSFQYEANTQILIKGKVEGFHHTDRNVLHRVK